VLHLYAVDVARNRSARLKPSESENMHPRTHELLTYLDTQRAALRDAFERVPRDQRDRKPAPDRWSAANIVEHLSIVEGRIAGRFAGLIAEARANGHAAESSSDPILPTIDLSSVANRSTRITAPDPIQPTGLAADAAWAALEQSRAALRDTMSAGDGLALGTITSPHPLFGPMPLYQWYAFLGAHEARHTAQMIADCALREPQDALSPSKGGPRSAD